MNSITFALSLFEPLITALTSSNISWPQRWRLLPLQLASFPINLHAYLTSPKREVIRIPTRSAHQLRAIVFAPKNPQTPEPRPLHIDFHGGAFLGGIAEYDARFCALLRDRSSAVVVSVQYRHAPANVYPAAHEDAEDAVEWLMANAKELWNADPGFLTVSGFSAGANLMMVAGRRAKAAVGFYAPLDLSIPPWSKPKPPGFPAKDSTEFLMPLYDAYAAGCVVNRNYDPRLSPIFKSAQDLPRDLLLVVPAIDILLHEQLSFVERLKRDVKEGRAGLGGKVESMLFEKGFHGWLEVPSAFVDNKSDREKAFGAAIDFIVDAHERK